MIPVIVAPLQPIVIDPVFVDSAAAGGLEMLDTLEMLDDLELED